MITEIFITIRDIILIMLPKLIFVFLLFIAFALIRCFTLGPSKREIEISNSNYTFTKKELETIADYFHKTTPPDYDGYLGHYMLSEDIMKIYRKKYKKDWD